jgi:hypothetical protein
LYRPLSCGRGDLDKKKDVKKWNLNIEKEQRYAILVNT